jgi:hypothetical protein
LVATNGRKSRRTNLFGWTHAASVIKGQPIPYVVAT